MQHRYNESELTRAEVREGFPAQFRDSNAFMRIRSTTLEHTLGGSLIDVFNAFLAQGNNHPLITHNKPANSWGYGNPVGKSKPVTPQFSALTELRPVPLRIQSSLNFFIWQARTNTTRTNSLRRLFTTLVMPQMPRR